MPKLNEVYGLARGLPQTYVTRTGVDDRFLNDITRDKHIVIHGSSKQGKTSLRRYNLKESDYIQIQCTRDTSKASLYAQILKKAGISIDVSATTTTTIGGGGSAAGAGSVGVPLLSKATVEVEVHSEASRATEHTIHQLEIDLQDPNDIARVLAEARFSKFIVVEDFHYLDEDVQRSLSFDFKVFHENSSLVFIIVGVWLETNRLTMFNGDLTGRVSTINVDRWEGADLKRVIAAGEPLLNIEFADDMKERIVDGCEGNVGLLQELCHRICEKEGVWQTQDTTRQIGDVAFVDEKLTELAAAQAARYLNALSDFVKGFGDTELQMYRWIAWTVVKSQPAELRFGIKTNEVYQRISEARTDPERLLRNNVIQALDRVEKLQFRHRIQPPILDHSDRRLRVIDAQFLVFLRTQPPEQILEAIGDPASELT